MDPLVATGPPEIEPYSSPRYLVVVVIFAVLVLGAGIFVAYQYLLSFSTKSNVSGRAYLSLLPLPTRENSAPTMGIYEYDLATRQIYKTLTDENSNMTPSYRQGEPQVLYSSRKGGADFQIELYDERVQLPPLTITNSTTTEKRLPAWSPDRTAFAFTAHPKGSAFTPNDWDVFLFRFRSAREEGGFFAEHKVKAEERIATGYSPVFSPDSTHLIYLKNDGIYAKSVNGGAEVHLASGVADLQSRFSISKDGTLLVWTRPEEHIVEIYAISIPLPLTWKSSLAITLLDPYFAGSNNEHLVGITDSPSILGTRSLVLINTDTLAHTEMLSLRLFDPTQITLSDIRQ